MVARKREPVNLSKYSMNTLLHCELNSEQVPESMQVDLLSLGGTPTHPYHPLILDATDGIFSHAYYFRYSVPESMY